MPYTGYEPFGPSDYSGGGLDPSFYYAISQGGRFPGDYENFLEYLAGQSRGTAGGNPDYDVPDWLQRLGRFGKLAGWHEKNVREGGEGQSPDLPGGYPYHFFSGPGAQFGPPGGPLHGLVDQGRPGGGTWDQDRPGGSTSAPKGGEKKGGGGGGKKYNFQWSPTQQNMQYQPSFVDWQPTQPFSGSSGPTRFVTGQGSPLPSTAAPPAGGTPGYGTPGGGQGKGKGKGKGKGGKGGGKGGKTTPPGGPGTPGSADDLLDWLLNNSPMSGRGNAQRFGAPGPGMREAIGGGVNPNNLDLGTPSWMKDPTLDPFTTKGMPGPTPSGPRPGESFDEYLTRLHDSGMDSGSILSMLGPYGFKQGEGGDWEWGWGTGPVVRDDSGYHFANEFPGAPAQQGTGNMPWFWEGGGAGFGGARGAGADVPSGGGAQAARNRNANAADWLLGGIFGPPAY